MKINLGEVPLLEIFFRIFFESELERQMEMASNPSHFIFFGAS